MADYNINAVARKVSYTGSAGLGPYAFSFEVLTEDDVAVYLNETLLTKTTDYNVTVNANGTGSVTLVTGGNIPTTPTATDLVVIVGARDIERTTDFVTAGDLRATALNEQLDALTIMVQQVAEEVERSVKAPVFDPTGINMILPKQSDRVNAFVAFDANGDISAAVPSDDVTTLAEVATDIKTLADIEDGTDATDAIQTAASISTDISIVSGISSDVTAVAADETDIGTVAADLAGANNIGTVAGSIANVDATGSNIADVVIVAADVNGTDTIGTVATDIANVNTTANNISDVNTTAGISADVTIVAGISGNVSTVSGISSDVTSVAGNNSNVTTVASNIANVNTVATNSSAITTVANDLNEPTSEIDTVASNIGNVNTVGADIANVNTVAGISADVSTVAGDSSDIQLLADSIDDINAKVNKTSDTGSAELPAGTTGQRDSVPEAGYIRFNTTDNIFEGYNGANWSEIGAGGGATGGGADKVFYENQQTVTADYTITANNNASSTGPLTIQTGVTVTVPSGSRWLII